MNRRTLFRTLAGALCAPLVKWLPKSAIDSPTERAWRMRTYEGSWVYDSVSKGLSPSAIIEADRLERERMFDEVERRFWSAPPEKA